MNLADAQRLCSALGFSLKKTDHGEYRVCHRSMSEGAAYYASDLDDAVSTATAEADAYALRDHPERGAWRETGRRAR